MKRRTLISGVIALVVAFTALTLIINDSWLRPSRDRAASSPIPATASETLITRPGAYRFDALGLILTVRVDQTGIIRYTLRNTEGKDIATSSERASANSRWALMVGSSRRIWFYSSDVGFFVSDGAGDGAARPVTSDPALRSAVPASMKGYLR